MTVTLYCGLDWNGSTFGSKAYKPITHMHNLPMIHFSCIPAFPFDLPTQSDT